MNKNYDTVTINQHHQKEDNRESLSAGLQKYISNGYIVDDREREEFEEERNAFFYYLNRICVSVIFRTR